MQACLEKLLSTAALVGGSETNLLANWDNWLLGEMAFHQICAGVENVEML